MMHLLANLLPQVLSQMIRDSITAIVCWSCNLGGDVRILALCPSTDSNDILFFNVYSPCRLETTFWFNKTFDDIRHLVYVVSTNMPIFKCPIDECTYQTEDIDPGVAVAMLTIHNNVHVASNPTQGISTDDTNQRLSLIHIWRCRRRG